jgi:hypothetical protein
MNEKERNRENQKENEKVLRLGLAWRPLIHQGEWRQLRHRRSTFGRHRLAEIGLLDHAALAAILRFQADLAKRRFVLRQVLHQQVRQRLSLLRTQIHALKILDG